MSLYILASTCVNKADGHIIRPHGH